MKQKKYTIPLSSNDTIDIMIEVKNKVIGRFAINYRAFIDGEWKEVYRLDNFHGFLHHQKFWLSRKPIPLDLHEPPDMIIEEGIRKIKENFMKYRRYMERK